MNGRTHATKSAALVSLLKACAHWKDLHKGILLHAEIARRSFEMDAFVGSALLNVYAKCGALVQAQEVFDMLPARNVVCWNALITGYAQHGCGEEAVRCYEQMRHAGVSPDAVTLASVFKACGSMGEASKGQEIHEEFGDDELLQKDIVIGTALVDMYAKCGFLTKAKDVFDGLVARNVVTWTALISGYVQHGHDEEALLYFEQMQQVGISPNAVTFTCILQACASMGSSNKGQFLHIEISRLGLLREKAVGTALVDMYAKCGLLVKAKEVFEALPTPKLDTWNALISGYAQNGLGEEALTCFKQMQQKAFSPDSITFSSTLKAYGSIGAGLRGTEMHSQIHGDGSIGSKITIKMALIDMYIKCGSLKGAQFVFRELQERDVLSWNAAISGYAQLGDDDKAFDSFDKMIKEGKVLPDSATFTALLNACSHKGLVDKGLSYFQTMEALFNITPTLEHHACMIDLLSRAGCVDKAMGMVKDMPFAANQAVLHTLLRACQNKKEMKLGKVAFEHAVELDEDDSGAYVCMRNLFGS